MENKKRKLNHYFELGAVYFVTSVTKERRAILTGEIAQFLLITIAYHKFVLNFSLFGYVIMPDHFHLLLQPADKVPLSKIMQFIKGNFARKYNEFLNPPDVSNRSRHLSVGYRGTGYGETASYVPVWQREYYESAVRDGKDFRNRINYIHSNPVTRGLVSAPGRYEFSSYHQYYGEPRQKIQIPIDKILL